LSVMSRRAHLDPVPNLFADAESGQHRPRAAGFWTAVASGSHPP
jgi:hypothetical protein